MNKGVWEKISELAKDDEGGHPGLHVIATVKGDISKPLLIIVHPGDAVEEAGDAPASVYRSSQRLQGRMSLSIQSRLGASDVVVVHRVSSSYALLEGWSKHPDYLDAVNVATDIGSVLYSDDLPKVAEWIEANLNASDRPSVYMTGAFSSAEDGCIARVAELLQEDGATIKIDPASPSWPGSTRGRWKPSQKPAQPALSATPTP